MKPVPIQRESQEATSRRTTAVRTRSTTLAQSLVLGGGVGASVVASVVGPLVGSEGGSLLGAVSLGFAVSSASPSAVESPHAASDVEAMIAAAARARTVFLTRCDIVPPSGEVAHSESLL
jgi:hypothetical protein